MFEIKVNFLVNLYFFINYIDTDKFPKIEFSKYSKHETQNFVKKMYNNSTKKLIASLIEGDDAQARTNGKPINPMPYFK